jgi:hypothetical protein
MQLPPNGHVAIPSQAVRKNYRRFLKQVTSSAAAA